MLLYKMNWLFSNYKRMWDVRTLFANSGSTQCGGSSDNLETGLCVPT